MENKLRNYVDSKCHWGYMTLCDRCVGEMTSDARKHRMYKQVDIYHCVEGFPTPSCERCGTKGVVK